MSVACGDSRGIICRTITAEKPLQFRFDVFKNTLDTGSYRIEYPVSFITIIMGTPGCIRLNCECRDDIDIVIRIDDAVKLFMFPTIILYLLLYSARII